MTQVLFIAACGPGPLGRLTVVGSDPSDGPIVGLSQEWLDAFAAGDALFERPFAETDGLGPLYIRSSCASCHEGDARGPGVVERFVIVEEDGVTPAADQSAIVFGNTRRPLLAAGAVTPIEPPDLPSVWVTSREPSAVMGRGYLEAVRDDEILRVADEQAQGGVVSGRPNLVAWSGAIGADPDFRDFAPGDVALIGRFGLKGRVATCDEFAADALQGDMGMTSPHRPDELPNPDGLRDDVAPGVDVDLELVDAVADYVRLIAIPERAVVPGGAELFAEVGCAACHTPSLRTYDDWPIEPLAGIDAPIYSDLLLHDLGPDASDGLVDGDAGPSEWKTAPLIGLRFLRSYLHDGRADTVEDAIVMHGGPGSEAEPSIVAFQHLSADDRGALVRFVEAL